MLRMVETFSGIGAQAKALSNIKCDFEILKTADWDINAIIAYDLIHNKTQEKQLEKYEKMTRQELLDRVLHLTLSTDGKKPATKSVISKLNIELLKRLCCAIDRSQNLISVTDIKGEELPEDTNILTYSFPCQDLSIASFWHGKTNGINRDANNRSSMLWQIERILQERYESEYDMPKFLLMENVRNINSKEHRANFEDWQNSLKNLGYYNKVLTLNSKDFGMPQNRVRVYMLSFFVEGNPGLEQRIIQYLEENDLENREYLSNIIQTNLSVKDILRTNYSNENYRLEADANQITDTKSRRHICNNNVKLYDDGKYENIVPTITTKQDRHPNSGVIKYENNRLGKCDFRYLTPRECFMLMGFSEDDFQLLMDNNFYHKKNSKFFSDSKLLKLAGNSIVVNVLEEIFRIINSIDEQYY